MGASCSLPGVARPRRHTHTLRMSRPGDCRASDALLRGVLRMFGRRRAEYRDAGDRKGRAGPAGEADPAKSCSRVVKPPRGCGNVAASPIQRVPRDVVPGGTEKAAPGQRIRDGLYRPMRVFIGPGQRQVPEPVPGGGLGECVPNGRPAERDVPRETVVAPRGGGFACNVPLTLPGRAVA